MDAETIIALIDVAALLALLTPADSLIKLFQAGRVLQTLDFPRGPTTAPQNVLIATNLIGCPVAISIISQTWPITPTIFFHLIFFTVAVYTFIIVDFILPARLCEKGIWSAGRLIHWNTLRFFAWDLKNPAYLHILTDAHAAKGECISYMVYVGENKKDPALKIFKEKAPEAWKQSTNSVSPAFLPKGIRFIPAKKLQNEKRP
jgi:hypothetical protein